MMPYDDPPYAELHCLTNFSFLRAASHGAELVMRAHELGYSALAVTDRHSLAGVVRAHAAARELGLKLLIGAECHPLDAPPVVLLTTNRASYARLTRLLTLGKSRAEKGDCRLTFDDLAAYGEGMLACIVGEATAVPTASAVARYREAFGDRAYLLAEAQRGPDDAAGLAQLRGVARRAQVPLVAAGGVYYHVPDRRPLQDALTAIRLGRTVAECGAELFANAERHLKPREELALVYESLPGALERTLEVAARCTFNLGELSYEYPEELAPPGVRPIDHLKQLTWRGAEERYPAGVPDKVRSLIEHELRLIEDLHYEAYFLTVWDLVRFARERSILCQGRGSAANSVVCYCLNVTAVDPDRIDVLFERFISRERAEAPDIDVDFEHERREEVLQYVYRKYGRERAAMTAEVICYRSRAASREIGKVLGLPEERINAIAKTMTDHHRNPDTKWRECTTDGGLDPDSRLGRQFIALTSQLVGFPRHLSQHVGGMVITQGPLCETVPIENARMPGRTVIEWDKTDLDSLGILKVDCLSLGMLTAIRKCFELVKRHYGRDLTLANIPPEDPAVYDMICAADTIGVFQIESRAQMSMLPRLKPRKFYDLVIEVSIVRPGPIQGNMVHPYLRRRNGEEPEIYPHEALREVLGKTLGVPLFQEQVMQLVVKVANFTAGEADQLRRAMGAWRRNGNISAFRDKLFDGMRANGLSEAFAASVYEQICGFGEYGFPESHAASFALLVYVSAWLKHHYPAAFCAAVINSQPMGFYAPAQLIRDAREHGVMIRSVDVNESEWDLTLEETRNSELGTRNEFESFSRGACPRAFAVRVGFRLLGGLKEAAIAKLTAARAEGRFESCEDLARRTKLDRATIELLARADAFGSLRLSRRAALWQALPLKRDKGRSLFDALPTTNVDEPLPAAIAQLTPFEEVLADYRTKGFSLRAHPMSFVRDELRRRQSVTARELGELKNGQMVRTAGLVLLRQRPGTAVGITFCTLEDETGVINLVVFPGIWQRFRDVARASQVWLVDGQLQIEGKVVHVVASRLVDFSPVMNDVRFRSRDFQ